MIQAGFSFGLSIWCAFVGGSFQAVPRLYSPPLEYNDDTLFPHFSQKREDVLSIPHQLQKHYIEKIPETIGDMQTLNGERYFRSCRQLIDLTDLTRYITVDWHHGSI